MKSNILFTSNSADQTKNLKAEMAKPDHKLSLTINSHEEVVDAFQGAKMWWFSGKTVKTNTLSFSWYPDREDRRFYRLTVHGHHRSLATEGYLPHVIGEGKAMGARSRKKKLFTNNASTTFESYHGRLWSSVVFDHPATFETLAMDPVKKKEVMEELSAFRERKEYYRKIRSSWQKGYPLYGPPGTGKSSMIASMTKFLDCDVYDLELTTMKDNTELRRLMFDTASRSIIMNEDIDSLSTLQARGLVLRMKKKIEAAAATRC